MKRKGNHSAVDVPPGCIGAFARGRRPLISPPVDSPTVRRIKRIYQGAGNQIAVETYEPHSFDPAKPTTCRAAGWDGATNRMHRANNWTGTGPVYGPLRDPTHGTIDNVNGLPFGGDPWAALTIIDDTNVLLLGSIWKLDAVNDPDPTFLNGFIHQGTIDAHPTIQKAMDYIGTRPGMIRGGVGTFVLKTGDHDYAPNAHFVWEGADRELTTVIMDDWRNTGIWSIKKSHCAIRKTCWIGNSRFQGHPRYIIKTTSTAETNSNFNFHCTDNYIWDVPGYGTNNGHPGGKNDLSYIGNTIVYCLNDGTDIKGPQNTNPELGERPLFMNHHVDAWGMGSVGQMRAAPVPMAADPVTTVADGRTTIDLNVTQKLYVGQRSTFSGLTGTGGIAAANINVSRPVKAVVKHAGYYTVTIDVGVQAAASITGGGAAGSFIAPAMDDQKPAIDVRGPKPQLIRVSGTIRKAHANGVRHRGGSGNNGNGRGGDLGIDQNVILENVTPADEDDGSTKFFVTVAKNVTLQGMTAIGRGRGFMIQSDADNFIGRGLRAVGCDLGGSFDCANMDIEAAAIGCTTGFQVDGGKSNSTASMPDDCFTFTKNSQTVSAAFPGHPFHNGDQIAFSGVEVTAGVDLNNDIDANPWTVAVDDANTFHFSSNQTAIADAAAAGGEDLSYTVAGVSHVATGQLKALTQGCTTGIVRTAKSTVQVLNSRSVGDTLNISDNTGGTLMGPGNDGYPNNDTVIDLVADLVLTSADSGKVFRLPSNAVTVINLTLPPPNSGGGNSIRGFKCLVLCGAGAGGATPTIGTKVKTPTGTINNLNNSSSAGGFIVSGSNGARMEVNWRSDTGYTVAPLGTWTLG